MMGPLVEIWDIAELRYKENQSAALLALELRAAGFTVTETIAGMATAFSAR